jgi:heme-degrading monooxygenase HmoA
MYARTARYEVPVGRIGDDIRQAAEIEKKVTALPGNRGFYYFVDRETGYTMSLTLWDTEAALKASAAPTKQLREQLTQPTDAKVVSVHEFETVLMPAEMGHARDRGILLPED